MLKNVKIYVPSEVSTEVQEALFSMGNKWRDTGKNIIEEPGEYFLINNHGEMARSYYVSIFDNDHPYKEYSYKYILDMFHLHRDVKLAWANGEPIQRKVYDAVARKKKWIDWKDSKSLDLSRGMDWRVKPKTETIKQWERKFFENGLVRTAVSLNEHEWSRRVNWISEPKQVEYTIEHD